MTVETAGNLVDALLQSRLLEESQLAALRKNGGLSAAPRDLLRSLIQIGWLTPLQANLLAAGRGAELSVGPYLLLERLGKGGSSEVFKARHHYMRRLVALKLIRQDQLLEEETVLRFLREIKLVSQLDHPHVVRAYDAGPANQAHFLAMEHVAGTDLARLVQRDGPLPVPQACHYAWQAALGLHYAHQQGLVHRDVKPSNFLVAPVTPNCPWGVVKLLDLGLARLRRSALGEASNLLTPSGPVLLGTPDFMAPEQAIDFHHADHRADIYSLGCTWYFLLTGQPPFGSGALAQKILRHQQASPRPIRELRGDAPVELDAILDRMMAKSPEERYQSAGQVADALAPLAVSSGPTGPPDIPWAIPLGPAPQAPTVAQGIVVETKPESRADPSWLDAPWKRVRQFWRRNP